MSADAKDLIAKVDICPLVRPYDFLVNLFLSCYNMNLKNAWPYPRS